MDQLWVVVSSYNNATLLPDCLRSVVAAHPGIPTTIYVVDAGSTDGTAAIVRRDFPAVRLRIAAANRGYAALNNLALREIVAAVPADADRTRIGVLLLNADTAMPPNALTDLLDLLAAHPEAGVIGPKIVLRDGSLDLACRRSFPTPLNSFWKLTGMAARYPHDPRFAQYNLTYHDPDEAIEMDSGMGACLLVRLAAIDEAGLMDERFFLYGEDLDWCYRIKAKGGASATSRVCASCITRAHRADSGADAPRSPSTGRCGDSTGCTMRARPPCHSICSFTSASVRAASSH